jgi:hypothetical protein
MLAGVKPTIPGRFHAQGLDRPRFGTAVEVVRHLGCVQSQLHDMALWAVARRIGGATLAGLRASFERGDFVRTHVLRPTWHFVAPEDLHWLLSLTGPRIRRLIDTTNRSIGLPPETVDRGVAVIVDVLRDGRPRTRPELVTALTDAGLPVTGQAVAHLVMAAEIDALVVNGPMRGKQHTYRLLDPPPAIRPRDELLAEIARRYARGHGAFRDKDLAWWTSLTLTDSRRAIELAELRPLDGAPSGGQQRDDAYWVLDEPVETEVPRVMLLSNFDEYISYARDPEDYAGFAGTRDDVMRGAGLLFVDGLLAGTWARTVTAKRVAVDVRTARRVTTGLRRGLQHEADAFGQFLDRESDLRLAD